MSAKTQPNIVVVTLLMAVVYYASGTLGQILAIPPGNITILWPPSGISLAAILLLGKRVLPGIFIGAFLANVPFNNIFNDLPLLLFGIAVGIGSSLQPLWGAIVLKQFQVAENPFYNRNSWKRFFAAVPIIALLSCSIGVFSLFVLGRLELEASFTWITWWAGDALGIALFTPIIFILFGKRDYGERSPLIFLAIIMSVVAITTMLVSIVLSYRTYIDGQRDRIDEIAQTQAQIIEAIAEFDSQFSEEDVDGGWQVATLGQIESAYSQYEGFGESGEYFLARNNNNLIEYVLSQRTSLEALPNDLVIGGTLAVPMSSALSGSTGTVIDRDYRGEIVLAAYAYLPRMELGLVVATDMDEIRAPFIRAAAIVVFITVLLVVIGIYFFQRISSPIVQVLQRKSIELEEQVTARTEQLSSLQEESQKQRDIIEATLNGVDTGIIMYSKDLKILASNTKFFELSKLPEEEWRDGDYFEMSKALFKDVLNIEMDMEFVKARMLQSEEFTTQLTMPDGVIIEVKHGPMRSGDGFIRTFEDVTERVRLVEQQIQQTELVRLLVETATNSNEATNFKMAISNCLDIVCKYTGWPIGHAYLRSEQDTESLVSAKLWHIEDSEKFETFKEVSENTEFKRGIGLPGRVLESNAPLWIEDVVNDPNFPRGRLVAELSVHAAFALPVTSRHGVVGVLEFFSAEAETKNDSLLDAVAHIGGQLGRVFERDQAEESLREALADAEAAADAKANFLASMSHEIRTPMNAVIGMVDLLRQTEMDEDQSHMLQTISESGQSLLTIINDILDFSKIEAGKLDLEKVAFPLCDVIESATQTVSINARNKNLRIISFVDPNLPHFVLGDQVRIRQIIINLVGNAIKFTEKGNIEVVAELDSERDERVNLKLSIRDQGIGISEEAQEELFTAFTQAESSTTRKYGGTGLGLSICERLAKLMGGSIEVESELGKGSTFIVNLPLSKSEDVSKEKARDLSEVRVLLVVEDQFERSVLETYLKHWQAEVVNTDSLEECIKYCLDAKSNSKPIDVVVMGPTLRRVDTFNMKQNAAEVGIEDTQFLALLVGKRSKARIEKEDIVSLNVDPVSRAEFISAVAICVGRASPEVQYHEEVESIKSKVRKLSIEEAREAGTLILVAEDNSTNRDVIGRQLTLLGHTFEMEEDGKLALDAWKAKDYGILLTDCHMPNMDGFQLTENIRNIEAEAGNSHRFPIVAITANALQGEAERCLAAGMDGYLSKPVDLKDLAKTLNRWLPALDSVESDTQPANNKAIEDADLRENHRQTDRQIESQSDKDAVVDISMLESLIGDDQDMLREVLKDFVDPSVQIVADIKTAHAERSAEAVQQSAHKLKSSARSIGANALADLCMELENAGKEKNFDIIDSEVVNIDRCLNAVQKFIEEF